MDSPPSDSYFASACLVLDGQHDMMEEDGEGGEPEEEEGWESQPCHHGQEREEREEKGNEIG